MIRPERPQPEPPLRHGTRVAHLVEALASVAGHGPDRARHWRRAARFHDIGKVAVPDEILGKEGALTPAENRVVRLHPEFGERLLSRWSSPTAELAATVARSHHECWDGSGYPDGLSGTDIHAAARMTAVADALDVMLTGRPYAQPISVSDALEELEADAGRQFDPDLVRLLVDDVGAVLRDRLEGSVGPRLDRGA